MNSPNIQAHANHTGHARKSLRRARAPLRRVAQVSIFVLALPMSVSCSGSTRSPDDEPERNDSTSNAAARAILDRVAEAAGGQENLNAIRTLAVQYVHTTIPMQTTSVETSAVPRIVDVLQVRDFENGRHLYEVYGEQGSGTWERVVILPTAAFAVNLQTNETTALASDAVTSARYGGIQLRWYVYAALAEATMAGPNLRHVQDTTHNDRATQIIRYPGASTETIDLWVDEALGLIVSRHIRANDPIRGDATARLEFGDYRNVGGIPMPFDVATYRGRQLFERFEMQEIRINAEIQESAFEPPTP